MTQIDTAPSVAVPDNCPEWCNAPHEDSIRRMLEQHAQLIIEGVIEDTPANRRAVNRDVANEWRLHSWTCSEGPFSATVDYDLVDERGTICGSDVQDLSVHDAAQAALALYRAVKMLLEIEAD